MATRLLAVMLTLLIGSPVCWCCFAHLQPESPVRDEAPACPMCAKKTTGNNGIPARKKSCQCERACSAREITQPTVAVTSATQTDLPPQAWVWENSTLPFHDERFTREDFTVQETGPPRPVGPLYLTHCALLN